MVKCKIVKSKKVNIPVICIGNVVVGGSGKTPTAISLCKSFQNIGKKVAFISRGYVINDKKSKNQVFKLDYLNFNDYDSSIIGDEAFLLSKVAPTYISRNRYLAAKEAGKDGAEIIIMDDGMQNNTLHKDMTLLVLDSEYGIGNGKLLPAGPLRERITDCIKKIDYVVVVYRGKNVVENLIKKYFYEKVILNAYVNVQKPEQFKNRIYVGMAAIGHPEKFFDTAKAVGVNFIKTFSFPDHYEYTIEELSIIYELAAKNSCKVITTRKDFQRIPEKFLSQTDVLDIDLVFDTSSILKKCMHLKN